MTPVTDDNPIDTTCSRATDDDTLRQAMALGHLDIEPFDDAISVLRQHFEGLLTKAAQPGGKQSYLNRDERNA